MTEKTIEHSIARVIPYLKQRPVHRTVHLWHTIDRKAYGVSRSITGRIVTETRNENNA